MWYVLAASLLLLPLYLRGALALLLVALGLAVSNQTLLLPAIAALALIGIVAVYRSRQKSPGHWLWPVNLFWSPALSL